MFVLYVLLILLLIFIILDLAQGFRLWLTANIEDDQTNIRIQYLYPLFEAAITVADSQPMLEVRLFHIRAYRKKLTKKNKAKKPTNARALLQSATYHDLSVSSTYGFQDPFYTGISYGSIGSLTSLLHAQKITITPDFLTPRNYVSLRADAVVSLGQTIVKYMKNK